MNSEIVERSGQSGHELAFVPDADAHDVLISIRYQVELNPLVRQNYGDIDCLASELYAAVAVSHPPVAKTE